MNRKHTEINPGEVYGRWIVIGRDTKNKRQAYNCTCACGNPNIKSVQAASLRNGHSKSCGCLRSDTVIKSKTIHGDGSMARGRHTLYIAYNEMLQANKVYNVHTSPWESYTAFKLWAYDNGWRQGLKLGRKNITLPSDQDNCYFGTSEQILSNKSNTVLIYAFGESKTAVQWSHDPRCCIAETTLIERLLYGIPAEEAITTPPRSNNAMPYIAPFYSDAFNCWCCCRKDALEYLDVGKSRLHWITKQGLLHNYEYPQWKRCKYYKVPELILLKSIAKTMPLMAQSKDKVSKSRSAKVAKE